MRSLMNFFPYSRNKLGGSLATSLNSSSTTFAHRSRSAFYADIVLAWDCSRNGLDLVWFGADTSWVYCCSLSRTTIWFGSNLVFGSRFSIGIWIQDKSLDRFLGDGWYRYLVLGLVSGLRFGIVFWVQDWSLVCYHGDGRYQSLVSIQDRSPDCSIGDGRSLVSIWNRSPYCSVGNGWNRSLVLGSVSILVTRGLLDSQGRLESVFGIGLLGETQYHPQYRRGIVLGSGDFLGIVFIG